MFARSSLHAATAVLLFYCLSAAGSGESETAVEQFARLQSEAHAASVSGDKQAHLRAALKILKLLNDAPDALEATAQAFAEAGDNERALTALEQFAGLGQADDNLMRSNAKEFATIKTQPRYQAILRRFAENKRAVERADFAFDLGDPGLLAEDIDYDPQSESFLITSVLEKKIIRVTQKGRTTDFAASPSHWPMLAIKIDASHKVVWATEVALDTFASVPAGDWGRSAIVCFDLDTGALRQRFEGPAHSALGDMALSREGEPIVSDGSGGGVYQLRKGQFEHIDRGEFISPQTPALFPDGRHVFVPDYARGIGVLDLASQTVSWLHQGETHAVNGIDGLYFEHGSLIATQNGTSPERVIQFRLNSEMNSIVSEQIIERATPRLGDPTHGVMVGEFFYYIANSGWNNVDDHGVLKPGAKFTPARIMRYRVRS